MTNTIDNKFEDKNNGVPMGRYGRMTQRRGSSSGGDTQNNQNNSDNKHSGNFKRGAGCFLIGACLVGSALGLGGYANALAAESNENANSREERYVERVFDETEGYRLVRRNNDIWREKSDGSEKQQITHTPNILELWASIIKTSKGEEMIYTEWTGEPDLRTNIIPAEKIKYVNAYLVKKGKDDSERIPIGLDKFYELRDKNY